MHTHTYLCIHDCLFIILIKYVYKVVDNWISIYEHLLLLQRTGVGSEHIYQADYNGLFQVQRMLCLFLGSRICVIHMNSYRHRDTDTNTCMQTLTKNLIKNVFIVQQSLLSASAKPADLIVPMVYPHEQHGGIGELSTSCRLTSNKHGLVQVHPHTYK